MKKKLTNKFVEAVKPEAKPLEVYDAETPGLLLRVQPSGAKTFYVRYRLHSGKRGRLKIGPAAVYTCAQARELAREHLAQALQGVDPAETKRKARAATLGVFLDEVYAARVHNKTTIETIGRVKRNFP